MALPVHRSNRKYKQQIVHSIGMTLTAQCHPKWYSFGGAISIVECDRMWSNKSNRPKHGRELFRWNVTHLGWVHRHMRLVQPLELDPAKVASKVIAFVFPSQKNRVDVLENCLAAFMVIWCFEASLIDGQWCRCCNVCEDWVAHHCGYRSMDPDHVSVHGWGGIGRSRGWRWCTSRRLCRCSRLSRLSFRLLIIRPPRRLAFCRHCVEGVW